MTSKEIKEVAEKAIEIMNKRITNEIFFIIQNNRDLMQEYLRAVKEKGVDTVNRTIGKKVKNSYRLSNINDRESKPLCTLIKSHQKFE